MSDHTTSKKPLYLHIGYPKTATTVLQKHYYPRMQELHYLGIRYDHESRFSIPHAAVDSLVYADTAAAGEMGKSVSEDLYKKMENSPALLSLEKIVGSFFTPRKTDDGKRVYTTPEEASRTIRALFSPELFDLKLIITLRRQVDALPSKYAQSFTSAYSKIPELDTFEKFIADITENEASLLRAGFDYDRVISTFEQQFGTKNICILPYEQFTESPDSFLKELCSFLGVQYQPELLQKGLRENVRQGGGPGRRHSQSSLFNLAADIKNSLFPRLKLGGIKWLQPLRNIKSPFQKNPGLIALDEEQQKQIFALFADSNRKLSARYNLDLGRYGYFLKQKDDE